MIVYDPLDLGGEINTVLTEEFLAAITEVDVATSGKARICLGTTPNLPTVSPGEVYIFLTHANQGLTTGLTETRRVTVRHPSGNVSQLGTACVPALQNIERRVVSPLTGITEVPPAQGGLQLNDICYVGDVKINPVADGNILQLHPIVYHKYTALSPGAAEFMSKFLLPYVKNCLTKMLAEDEATRITCLQKELLESAVAADLSSLSMRRRETETARARENLHLAQSKLREAQEEYRRALSTAGSAIDLEGLRNLVPALYSSIRVEGSKVIAQSNPITIRGLYLGTIQITVDTANDNFRVTSNRRDESHTRVHPHVDGSGYACLGNISTSLPKIFRDGDVFGGLVLAHQYLQSYYGRDAYWRIETQSPKLLSLACPTEKQQKARARRWTIRPAGITRCTHCGRTVHSVGKYCQTCPGAFCNRCIDLHKTCNEHSAACVYQGRCQVCGHTTCRGCSGRSSCPSCGTSWRPTTPDSIPPNNYERRARRDNVSIFDAASVPEDSSLRMYISTDQPNPEEAEGTNGQD